MRPGQCGTDPRAQLLPGDQVEVDRFEAYLKERTVKPKVVCICGSMRFAALMQEHAAAESLSGRIVVMPHVSMAIWGARLANPDESMRELGQLHRAKIRMASEMLVVGDYVGDSTRAEITYARWLGLPVRFTHPDVDPGTEADR
ncbi:hypothetical protein [Streptacidiphilus cavernicola]|uniref:Uncharacterized protein n=1 Tax=Streptacidiphilus cavernicola TaxID=3342716 RepID=A0ABV6VXS5_9ACTN